METWVLEKIEKGFSREILGAKFASVYAFLEFWWTCSEEEEEEEEEPPSRKEPTLNPPRNKLFVKALQNQTSNIYEKTILPF